MREGNLEREGPMQRKRERGKEVILRDIEKEVMQGEVNVKIERGEEVT